MSEQKLGEISATLKLVHENLKEHRLESAERHREVELRVRHLEVNQSDIIKRQSRTDKLTGILSVPIVGAIVSWVVGLING